LSPGSKWHNQPHFNYQLNRIKPESLDSEDVCSEDSTNWMLSFIHTNFTDISKLELREYVAKNHLTR